MRCTRDGAGTERMLKRLQNDVPHRTTLGLSQKEAEKHPGVDPNLTFENIPFRGSRPQTVWRGFHGQAFCADLGFIGASGRLRRTRPAHALGLPRLTFGPIGTTKA